MADEKSAAESKADVAQVLEKTDDKDCEISNNEVDEASKRKDLASTETALTSQVSPGSKAAILIHSNPNLTSGDKNSKKNASGTSTPSTDETSDGDFSSLSTTSSSSDERTVIEKDSKNAAAKKTSSTKDSSQQATSAERQSYKASSKSYFKDQNFSDSDDSSGMNIELYQAILESLRDLKKPKEVDIGKVVSRRPKRRRSNVSVVGGDNSPSQADCIRSPKRIQRDLSSIGSCPPTPLPSSESSQDTVEQVKPAGPTQFSTDLISEAKLHKEEGTSTSIRGTGNKPVPEIEKLSIERSATKKSDCLDILKYDVASALKRTLEAASCAAVKESPKSPPVVPNRRETLAPCPIPMQTPGNLIIADRSTNDPHARRVNSLTSLIDRIVEFSGYMESHPLLSVPGPAPRRTSPQTFSLPGHSSYPTLRELEEAFRRGFLALQEDTSDSDEAEDEDEATRAFKKSVREMRDHLRQLADGIAIYSDSDQEETVPPSDDPITIGEIGRILPRLWQGLRYNNMLMNQWTTTLLDWCLEPIPECRPQQFYDAEAGIRALYGRIDDVRRSTARLLNRWRSRRMDTGELGDLTYLMTMASTAMSMYSTLESEVINVRFAMGTRQSAGGRRRQREDSDKSDTDESFQRKKGKKEELDESTKSKRE